MHRNLVYQQKLIYGFIFKVSTMTASAKVSQDAVKIVMPVSVTFRSKPENVDLITDVQGEYQCNEASRRIFAMFLQPALINVFYECRMDDHHLVSVCIYCRSHSNISARDVSGGEDTDEPAHVCNLKGQKHQMGGVVHVYSALRIQNPVSGLRSHILLKTFCRTLIYPYDKVMAVY